jgi:hypothetical protein
VRRLKRTVTISDSLAAKCRGGRTQIWGFGVVDLAEALGETEDCIRQRINRGTLDPTTLLGLAEAMRGHV